jgi:Family of unknown function (DUF5709)
MPERRHESQDLGDYETRDASDTLEGNPGDDPLDRGVAAPGRWSAGMRDAWQGRDDTESLDELLSEEEPDETADPDGEAWDENATEGDVSRLRRDDDPDPRAGRLVATDEDTDDVSDTMLNWESTEVARDQGIDGGGASAEESAVHVIGADDQLDEDTDQ